MKEYRAVAYFRVQYVTGVQTTIVIVKSKIIPTKPQNTHRLELLGSLVAA